MERINDKWDIWYHSITDNNWSKDSYKNIFTIENLLDYKYITDTYQQNHYQNGMFFCMKEDIFPNWEDPDNRNGGCLSFKIPSVKIIEEWNNLLLKCIKELILKDNNDEINGISISPKKEFNIIKIWFKNREFKYDDLFNSETDSNIKLDKSLYKKHDI
jgi:hypothetical protein